MLRSVCASVLQSAASLFGDVPSEDKLRLWCVRASRQVLLCNGVQDSAAESHVRTEVMAIRNIAVRLFSDAKLGEFEPRPAILCDGEIETARAWLGRVDASRWLNDPLPPRTGFLLDHLDQDRELPAALREQLLRHVEVRRRHCLSRWRGAQQVADINYERLAVAFFLFRAASRNNDLRFLNSGLKMFDWFGAPYCRRTQATRFQLRLVLTAMERAACLESLVPA